MANLTLWHPVWAGFGVIGMVHREALIERPDEGGHVSRVVVEPVITIQCEKIAAVLVGNIPVACEAALATCWSKDAQEISDGDRMLPWSPPENSGVPDGPEGRGWDDDVKFAAWSR